MKRFWIVLSAIVLTLTVAFVLTACGQEEVKLVSIRLDSSTIKSTYKVGETPDWDKAQLILTMSDGTEQRVSITSSMLSTAFNSETEGKRNITIVYNNKSYLFSYTVIAAEIASHVVSVSLEGVVTEYKLNESIRYEGSISATFDNGTSQTWQLADLYARKVLTVNGFHTDKAGDFQCQLSYESAMGTVTVTYAYSVAPLAEIVSAALSRTQPFQLFVDDTREAFIAQLSQYPFVLKYADDTEAEVYVQSATAIDRAFNTEQVRQSNSVMISVNDAQGRTTRVSVQYSVVERFNVYNVTFDPGFDDILPITEQTDEASGKITRQNFDRRGYECLGWFVDNTDGEEFNFNSVVTRDLYLVAKWIRKEYYIKITSFGVPYGSIRYYNVEQTVVLDSPVATNGYDFLYYAYNGTPIANNTIYPGTFAENLDIVAEWQPIEYKLEYRLNDSPAYPVTNAEEFATTTYTIRDARNITAAIRPGYTFTGWSTDSAGNNIITTLGGTYGDKTLYANWTADTYYVNFAMGTTGDAIAGRAPQAFSVNSTNIEIRAAAIEGYRFEGWYTDINCQEEFYKKDGVYMLRSGTYTQSFTLYALATPVYTLYLASEHTDTPTKLVFAEGEDASAGYLADWEAASSRFACDIDYWWYIGEEGENALPSLQLRIEETETGTTLSATTTQLSAYNGKTFTAVWKGHRRTITYKYGDYTEDKVITYDTYQGTVLEIPTRDGYQFNGWRRSNGAYAPRVEQIGKCEYDVNLVFYAYWTVLPYKLTFHYMIEDSLLTRKLQNVQTTAAYTVDTVNYTVESTTIDFSPLPEAKYNSFGGWYTSLDYSVRMNNLPTGSHDISDLYAKWMPTQYGIHYYNKDGAAFQGKLDTNQLLSVNYATHKLVLYAPTRAGYTFGGWYADKDLTIPCDTDESEQFVVDIDALFAEIGDTLGPDTGIMQYVLSVYAKWIAIPYTLKFNGGKDGNTNVTTLSNPNLETGVTGTVTFSGDDVKVLAPATANGYTFLGWFDKVSGGNQISSTQDITQNLEVYPQWEKATYTITYADFDEDTVATLGLPTTYQLGGNLSGNISGISTKMKRFGYTLGGVYLNSECTGSAITALGSRSPNGTTLPYCQDVILYGKWTLITNYKIQLKYENTAKTGFVNYTTCAAWGGYQKTNISVLDTDEGLDIPALIQNGYVTKTEWFADTALSKSVGDKIETSELQQYATTVGGVPTLVLYAPFEMAVYAITFVSNNEDVSMPQADTFTYFDGYDKLTTPEVPAGYRWIGWYTDAQYTAQPVTSIAKNTYSADLVLYGRTELLRTITFNTAGANALDAQQYCIADTTLPATKTLPVATTSDNTKTFSGWLLDGVNIGTELPNGTDRNITLTALFYNSKTTGFVLNYNRNGTYGIITRLSNKTVTSCTVPTLMGTIDMFNDDTALPIGGIGTYAFENCKFTSITLTGISIPTGSYIFNNCQSLTTVILENCQIANNSHMFLGCTKLTTIKLNSDNVGAKALMDCTALVTLYTKGDVSVAGLFDTLSGVPTPSTFTTLRVTGSTLGTYFGDSISTLSYVTKVYFESATEVDISGIKGYLATRTVYVPNALLSTYQTNNPTLTFAKM